MTPKPCFRYIEEYLSARLDCDLSQIQPGQTHIVETPRRLKCEPNYDDIRVFWWLKTMDGRSAISLPPCAADKVRQIINEMPSSDQFGSPTAKQQLQDTINNMLAQHEIEAVSRMFTTLVFACNADQLQKHTNGECRRLTDTSLPTAEGFKWPPYTFIEGILYGVVVDGQVVSTASSRPIGILEDRVVDVSIMTAPAYKRMGYAKTAVSALVEHVTKDGGEAVYIVRPENQASVATARSVGFADYGTSLTMRAPTSTSKR